MRLAVAALALAAAHVASAQCVRPALPRLARSARAYPGDTRGPGAAPPRTATAALRAPLSRDRARARNRGAEDLAPRARRRGAREEPPPPGAPFRVRWMLTPALPGSRPRVIPVRARFAATRSSAASDADAAGRSARFTRNPAGPRESLLEDGEADSGSKEVAPPLAPTRGPGSLLVLNLVCSSCLLLLVSPRSCSWASPAGPHYSLAGLYNSKQDYIFHDNFNLDTYNFTFTVQMCGNVNNPPPACAPPGRMAYRSCTSGTCASQCTSVALDYNTKPTPITYTYHDPTKPGSGWNVTYLGPAIAGCPSNTAFTVAHLCADQAFPAAGTTFNTLVRLVNDCQYEAYVPSLAGCPAECPLGKNGRLCSGQGICQYDTDLGNARCFCDNGFIEKDCSAPYDPTPAGPVVGAVFGGLFLGAGLVGGYWWFMKRTPTREPEMGYYNAPLDG